MPAGELHGVVDAAAPAARADPAAVDAGLRDETAEGGVDVAGPFLLNHLLAIGRRQRVEALAAALAEAAVIEGDGVKALRGERLAEMRPGLALAVAHVQQHDARAGLPRRKVGGLE